MVSATLALLALQGPITASQFVDPEGGELRRERALNAKNLAPLLRTLRSAPPEVRSRPETQFATHMVSAMVTPPVARAGWLTWMRESERLSPAPGEPAGQLKPLLAYHLARRTGRPEAVAYLVGFSSDASSAQMQMGYTQELMREKAFPFWRLVRDGLPVLNTQMRQRARETIGGAAGSDSPITTRRQLGLARKWLPKADLPGVERAWRRWTQNSG